MTTETEVRERPILFSDRLVRAILDGRKTQTRRVVKVQPPEWWTHPRATAAGQRDSGEWRYTNPFGGASSVTATIGPCPYGGPGDRLYVREAWATPSSYDHLSPTDALELMRTRLPGGRPQIWYRATTRPDVIERFAARGDRWRPSIHMPKGLSRITLEVTGVRVERLQEIRPDDVVAEGIENPHLYPDDPLLIDAFARLWDQINASRGYGWDANPWVWVIEFRRVEG